MKIGRSVIERIKAFAGAFRRREDGAIAVQAALVAVPLLVLVLGMVDVSRAASAKHQLQDALDAATLAAARSNATEDVDLQKIGDDVLAADLYGAKSVLKTSSFKLASNRITATATATMTPLIAGIWLNGDMELGASTEVTRNSYSVEVALALDVTGSMKGTKITGLKAAAAELIDIVVQDVQKPYYSKVAIVPYSMGVNVGDYAANVRGGVSSGTCTNPGCQKYKFLNPSGNYKTFTISNCVSERTGSDAFTDAAPSNAPLGRNYPSTNNPCLGNTIVPLSSDKAALKASVEALQASGSTAGHIGVGWGWYMVSPKFGYLWPEASRPAEYGTQDLLKVVVLMTDGEYNTSYCNGVIAKSSTSGSGETSDHINCDAPNGSAFVQATKLCDAMKASGVVVYTVGFEIVNDQKARDLVNNCATSAKHVYLPSGETALKDAFRAIATDINALRLSR